MSLFDPDDAASLRRGRIRYFPVVPQKLEFAACVRQEILRETPGVVAVELPETLQDVFLRGVERLPEMSVVLYDTGLEDEAIYVPVEPADPFTEALRSAREAGVETVFLDPDVSERPHLDDVYPDAYALNRIGLETYVAAYRKSRSGRSHEAAVHAEALAWKLQGCDPRAEILVVVSLNLLDPLLRAMERPQTQPLRKVRRKGVRIFNLHPETLAEATSEAPFLQAVYESRRSGPPPPQPPPQPAASAPPRRLYGFDILEQPKTDPRETELAAAAAQKSDRQKVNFRILAAAEKRYERSTGETLARWQRRLWSRYTRNLALSDSRLQPSLFDLTVAARGLVDDNFAWELWETGNYYPFQKIETDLATVKVTGEQMWVDRRRITLRRRSQSKKSRSKPVGLRGRKREKNPGDWARQWRSGGLCSYPPEDFKIEDYGQFLKKKGKSVLSEERSRTEPFTTSLRDGIDLRETLRNWHTGKRIYVRENQRVDGEVGAVVIVFDEDRDDRYGYRMTWLGEHQNESDMAFYATDPFQNTAGPGIGRAEYGGLLLSLPSQRMADVWTDPDYSFAESKPEVLLLAGLDYSLERIVVYVAPQPPRSIFRSIAGRIGRKIIYIPSGNLSPTALKKVRTFHVLDGHDRRETAKNYIW